MLINYKNCKKYLLCGAEGETIGPIKDIYFDDFSWTVRYFVVDVVGWLSGRKILISPESVSDINHLQKLLLTKLTRDQIEKSPLISDHEPVYRQQEKIMADYYAWSPYWNFPLVQGFGGTAVYSPYPFLSEFIEKKAMKSDADDMEEKKYDIHLRSFEEVVGYSIEATDGDLGHVEDFLISLDNWKVSYLVIDTRNWLPGEKVAVGTDRIFEIDWALKTTSVDLDRKTLKKAPRFDPSSVASDIFSRDLSHFYCDLNRSFKEYKHIEKNSSRNKDQPV